MRPNRLPLLSAVIFLLAIEAMCQNPPTVTQEAKSSPCSNIVALAGDVKVNCSSLTPAQEKLIEGIPALLHKMLANQLDPNAVMAKLDEILKAVNPNVAPKVYMCNGLWRSAGPGLTSGGQPAMMSIQSGGDTKALDQMIRLNKAGDYAGLLKACQSSIEDTPEWLTPRLFCGLAYLATNDKVKAREMLAEFDSRTGPYYSLDGCKDISEFLHSQLK